MSLESSVTLINTYTFQEILIRLHKGQTLSFSVALNSTPGTLNLINQPCGLVILIWQGEKKQQQQVLRGICVWLFTEMNYISLSVCYHYHRQTLCDKDAISKLVQKLKVIWKNDCAEDINVPGILCHSGQLPWYCVKETEFFGYLVPTWCSFSRGKNIDIGFLE